MLREKADCRGNAFDSRVDVSDPHMTVAALLTSALGHLDGDPTAAKRCVEQAAELLGNRTAKLGPKFAVQAGLVRGGLAPWQIRQLRLFIAENLASSIAIEDLAAICRLSVSHFSRAFKASFGEPPHSYVMRQRIEEAKRLMLECEEPLSQIALACGFADQSHFCRTFRRTEGDSPNLWRRLRASGLRVAVAD
jgi:AraC-like DNA-binding protein